MYLGDGIYIKDEKGIIKRKVNRIHFSVYGRYQINWDDGYSKDNKDNRGRNKYVEYHGDYWKKTILKIPRRVIVWSSMIFFKVVIGIVVVVTGQ